MPWYPEATRKDVGKSSGRYLGGEPKIVHHTTEGDTARGAFSAYRQTGAFPHFTVDATTIYQHLDTGTAASAVRNQRGGVETNRWWAIQIEVVGRAGKPKSPDTLRNVARLCRWLEKEHRIPAVWPSGPPKQAVNGRDPGGHNRSVERWRDWSGHFGHSQIPENSHWDPAYSAEDLAIVMNTSAEAPGQNERDAVPVRVGETTLRGEVREGSLYVETGPLLIALEVARADNGNRVGLRSFCEAVGLRLLGSVEKGFTVTQ